MLVMWQSHLIESISAEKGLIILRDYKHITRSVKPSDLNHRRTEKAQLFEQILRP